jgi:aryl-alcohol dehydrogenase-like predicted oxidoreductase
LAIRVSSFHRGAHAGVAATLAFGQRCRYILDRPAVAGVIVGARLGVTEHLADNARVFSFALDDADRARIETVLGRSHDLFESIGDCGDEYR